MVRGRRRSSQPSGGTAAIAALDPDALPENGSTNGARPRAQYRRLGSRSALSTARRFQAGTGPLPPWKAAQVALSARLYCHAINVSNRLYSQGEWRADGELKQDLSRLMELDRQVSESLRYLFGDDGADASDPLSALLRNDSGYVSGAKR